MKRLLQFLLAVVLIGSMLVGPARAAPADTVVGTGTPASCTESAFDAAVAAGGTITFDCGGPKTIQLTAPATLSIDHTTIDGGNAITLTANLTTSLLFVGVGTRVSLSHIILDKGYAKNSDGGAIFNFGDLTLNNVRIQNSVADEFGGAIYTLGDVNMRNSTLADNSAGSGGAIYALSVDLLKIKDSTLMFNTALNPTSGVGGAIALVGASQLAMSGGSLHHNQAAVQGGAVDMEASATATFGRSSAGGTWLGFNTAKAYGGAISNNGGVLMVEGADLEYNSTLTPTLGYGGAIDDEGTMMLDNSRIANSLGRFGGGVFVGGKLFNASAAITRTVFFANNAAVFGGGLYTNINTTTVTIENSAFQFNQAGSGGGLTRTNAHLSISKSSFTSNQAQNGGAMFLWGAPNPSDAGYVELRDTTISGNLATTGHSGGIDNSALLDMRNVTIKGNHYGLYDENGGVGRLQSTVLDNPGPNSLNCDGDGTGPTSGGHNYSTDNSCALTGFGDSQGLGLDAKLGPLTTDPLVFTMFHLPLAGSPLINNGGPSCSATDQRYALRLNACDIGAIEFGGLLPRLFVPLIRK